MADTLKSAQAQERAAKKAARRAAFIQEVAVATALLVCGPGTKRGPFAQAYYEWDRASWRASQVKAADAEGLFWAIQQGLLPEGTIVLPAEDEQRRLLATLPG